MILKTIFITIVLHSLTFCQEDLCASNSLSEDNCLFTIFNSDYNGKCCFVSYSNKNEDNIITECRQSSIDISEFNLKEEILNEKQDTINTDSLYVSCPKEGLIKNNCGVVGLGEPFKKEHCSVITISEKYCCFLSYKLAGDTETHHVCRLVDNYINEGKTTKESRNLIERLLEGAVLEQGVCSQMFTKHSLSWLVLSLVLLIL